MQTWPGNAFPLGATFDDNGTNVSLVAEPGGGPTLDAGASLTLAGRAVAVLRGLDHPDDGESAR